MAWDKIKNQHSQALQAFVDKASALSTEAWDKPIAEGKWSPAQITQHLILAYEIFTTELLGGPSIKVRTKGLKRLLIRYFIVPRMLRTGKIPEGVPAPRESRPEKELLPQVETLLKLKRLGDEVESLLKHRLEQKDFGITHPYAGKLSPLMGLQFCAVHVAHHGEQLRA